MAWKCPRCGSGVKYHDYNHVLRAVPFSCHECRLLLVLDKAADRLMIAPTLRHSADLTAEQGRHTKADAHDRDGS